MWLAIKLFWSTKMWPWLKKYPWQVIAFLASAVAAILVVSRRKSPPSSPPVPIPPDLHVAETEQKHEQAVEELHQKAEALLTKASEQQVKEYQELKQTGKPEDIAKWIDQLS